ncbi:MAG TPA: type II toxin-antitoxin system RelE/ParE family toxin [Acidobacteriaceae bacterium]|nr:type II toxin-antitoxin system RelE/ParE family toxin [Acidobacteriaceae bacterium]
MRAELLWSPQAREDLLEIYSIIGQDNLDAAERFFAAMESKANLLVSHPRLGVRRPEIQSSARILMEGAYLLLYETHPDTDAGAIASIEIVRVVDGRRDLRRQL